MRVELDDRSVRRLSPDVGRQAEEHLVDQPVPPLEAVVQQPFTAEAQPVEQRQAASIAHIGVGDDLLPAGGEDGVDQRGDRLGGETLALFRGRERDADLRRVVDSGHVGEHGVTDEPAAFADGQLPGRRQARGLLDAVGQRPALVARHVRVVPVGRDGAGIVDRQRVDHQPSRSDREIDHGRTAFR
jgi:hypothetical protein